MTHFVVLVIGEDVEGQLAPYDEDGEWNKEGSKWDWWEIGGRWTGFFKLKPGVKGKLGRAGLMTPTETRPDRADQAMVKDIDWDGMVADARAELQKDVDAAGGEVPGEKQGYLHLHGKPATVAEFLERASWKLTPNDIVKDGKWYSAGDHGWWGLYDKKIDDATWKKKARELIDSLAPETLLTAVDCHV